MPELNLPISLTYDMTYMPGSQKPLSQYHRAFLDHVGTMDPYADKVRFHEHHGVHTSWTSSPLVLASAAAARTTKMRIEPLVATPFYHPIRLAEDLAVLDQLSNGRAQVVLAPAYRSEEFEMYGANRSDRRKIVDTVAQVLKTAWKGEPFMYEGRHCLIRPTPVQQDGLRIALAGTAPSAGSAAGIADWFEPLGFHGWDTYVSECERLGKAKPVWPSEIHIVCISEDPERAARNVIPALQFWVDAIKIWSSKDEAAKVLDTAEKRESFQFFRGTNNEDLIVTPDRAVELIAAAGDNAYLRLYPMHGGYDPDLATTSLELLVTKVLPRIPESVGAKAMRASVRI